MRVFKFFIGLFCLFVLGIILAFVAQGWYYVATHSKDNDYFLFISITYTFFYGLIVAATSFIALEEISYQDVVCTSYDTKEECAEHMSVNLNAEKTAKTVIFLTTIVYIILMAGVVIGWQR